MPALLLLLTFALSARAQSTQPALLDGIGIDQQLGAQIPADLIFRDETGREVRLGDYFGKRPIVLALVYYKCPMLCTLVLNDLTRGLNGMPINVGEQFDVLTVSFDPSETPDLAAQKKKQYLREYRRPHADEGWHFLTGDQPSIDRLTQAVGFHYKYDPKFDQYVHSSGLTVLTPQGRISKYFFGIGYSSIDLRLALADASGSRVGSPTERILLYCFHYDPSTGRYSLAITRLLRVAGAATIALLATLLFVSLRRERAARPRAGDASQTDTPEG